MKKIILLILFLGIIISSYSQRQPRKLGYIKVDSAQYDDNTVQSTAYIEDSVRAFINDTADVLRTEIDDTASNLRTDLLRKDAVRDSINQVLTDSNIVDLSQLNDSLANYMDSTETIDSIDSRAVMLTKNAKAKGVTYWNADADTLVSDSTNFNYTDASDSLFIKIIEWIKGYTDTLILGGDTLTGKASINYWTLDNDSLTSPSSKNVGIGTNAPLASLHVAGSGDYPLIFEPDAADGGIEFRNAGSSKASIRLGGSGAALRFQTGGITGGVERLRITDAGVFQWNPLNNDLDFRVDGNTTDYILFANAGNERIGIGLNNPQMPLHIQYSRSSTAIADMLTFALENTDNTTNNGSIISAGGSVDVTTHGRLLFRNTDHTAASENVELEWHSMKDGSLVNTTHWYADSSKWYVNNVKKMWLNSLGLSLENNLFIKDSIIIVDNSGIDSVLIFDDGDTTRIESDNPIKIGENSLIIDENNVTVNVNSDYNGMYINSEDENIVLLSMQRSGVIDSTIYISGYSKGGTKFRFHAAGDSYFNGGNLGIKETNPSQELHVNGDIQIIDSLFIDTTISLTNDGDDLIIITDSLEINGTGNNSISLYDASNNKDVFISTSGNSYFKGGALGIKIDPVRILHSYSGLTDFAFRIESSDAKIGMEFVDNTATSKIYQTAGTLYLDVNGDDAGEIEIKTDTTNINHHAKIDSNLYVEDTIHSNVISIGQTDNIIKNSTTEMQFVSGSYLFNTSADYLFETNEESYIKYEGSTSSLDIYIDEAADDGDSTQIFMTEDYVRIIGNDSIILDGLVRVDEIIHGYFFFEDSSITVTINTQNTWEHVTNATNTLFADQESDEMSITNDTITINETGHLEINWGLVLDGSNGNNIEVRMYNITDAAGVPIKDTRTTRGAGNRDGLGKPSYDINATAGDKYIMQVRNTSGTANVTVYDGSIFIKETHF